MIVSNSCSNTLYQSVSLPIEPQHTSQPLSKAEIEDALFSKNAEWFKKEIIDGKIDPRTIFSYSPELESKLLIYCAIHFPEKVIEELTVKNEFKHLVLNDSFILKLCDDKEKQEEIIELINNMVNLSDSIVEILLTQTQSTQKEEKLYPLFLRINILSDQFHDILYKDFMERTTEIHLFECFITMGEIELAKFVMEQANMLGSDLYHPDLI